MADIAHKSGISNDEDSPECLAAKRNANEITSKIEDLTEFKALELPLQGQTWKEISSLEKEQRRLKNLGSENPDDYKTKLNEKMKELRQKQNNYGMSDSMTCFISGISNEKERMYFLKWMRMNLDSVSHLKLSKLREQYKKKSKENCSKQEIKEIDMKLSDSSLGIEHFFRELGQIYEASLSLQETDPSRQQLQHLPKLCAELMLDGFPLEIIDGDASNIPLNWGSSVLSQLKMLVSPKNKLKIITVLGVQSTGKSTLLNTMFGVQFAVSSGRCTRGAFMELIKVSDDIKQELNCDFVVIIDTEGLKSPELVLLENSFEHDNELATLVVGLSDLTIINIAMENSTEMKDILQIVVHAFLRMKEVGKKPKCQFVHQNVSDISAHDKNLRDRKLLLEQLDEMTQAAAKMEKKGEQFKSFTDVIEYNPDSGSSYIPGLWNGNPPMAPVNAGYSDAVYEVKKNIILQMGQCKTSTNNVKDFIEWINSLWDAVRHENFIFSFRNSLVADAYMNLCKKVNQWEWEFKKDMFGWATDSETKVRNFGTVASSSSVNEFEDFIKELNFELTQKLSEWEEKILHKLEAYFKQKEGHVYLVESYKAEFSNSVKNVQRETKNSVANQLMAAADIKKGMEELDKIKQNHTGEIEKAVCELIDECRKKNLQMTDEELDKESSKMWEKTLHKMSFREQKPKDVFQSVYFCLRDNLAHRGSHASELLDEKSLQDVVSTPFTVTKEMVNGKIKTFFKKWRLDHKNYVEEIQNLAQSIINDCQDFINEKQRKRNNYHDTFTQEILRKIDEKLSNDSDRNIIFEVSLKQHICAVAATQFQKMHEDLIQENDPYICLNKNKGQFCADFKDVFHKRDQCQKKAAEFTEQCLKPAVEDYVYSLLGLNIVDEMHKQEEFSTRMSFQYSVLLDLLSKDFNYFLIYTSSYEEYVKLHILDQIQKLFPDKASTYEERHVKSSIDSIHDAIKKAKPEESSDLKTFIEHICKHLGDKLVFPQNALGGIMLLNKAEPEQFKFWLQKSVDEIEKSLLEKFKITKFKTKLEKMSLDPQKEIFDRVVGCGHQCPFCKVPCDAGSSSHSMHFASLHRPDGLGRYKWRRSNKLSSDICTTSVISDNSFCCSKTGNEWHPYKRFQEIFPDWKIPPDSSLEASDYWKYVMTKYNNQFAEAYGAVAADIPDSWKKITEEQARESLSRSFNVKC